jgi:phage terminase large subunit-like protein
LLDWAKRFCVRKIYFDPFQFVSTAQRLEKAHIAIESYAQSPSNLTAATQNLYDLLQSRSLMLYPDAGMRLAVSRAVVTESSRGWKLDKLKQAHRIDVVVALSMAALAAVRGQDESFYNTDLASWVGGGDDERDSYARARMYSHIMAGARPASMWKSPYW